MCVRVYMCAHTYTLKINTKSWIQLLAMLSYFSFFVYVCVCGFVYFYFPDSLLGISRRTCPQMETVPFGKSPVPDWWWKSKWGRKHHSKRSTAVTSCVTQETKAKSRPTTWQSYVSPGGNLREWVCFVSFQCNVSQTPPKISGWTVTGPYICQ